MEKQFSFKPVYGYGWRSGDAAIDVPAPFVVEGKETRNSIIEGKVAEPHVFSNRSISLNERSGSDWVTQFNVVIHSEGKEEEVTGFAELLS